MKSVVISSSLDNFRSSHMRFLEEAARLGPVHVLLWSDETVRRLTGAEPKFLQDERRYFVESVRYVQQVSIVDDLYSVDGLHPAQISLPAIWAVPQKEHTFAKQAFCRASGIEYRVIAEKHLKKQSIPDADEEDRPSLREKVVVTGWFDWLHTGHVRFFEEASQLGDLYVVVGRDRNVRLLKGEGHPLFGQAERRYMVQGIRFVHQALISSGTGWMDAEPEIERLKPDVYVVNEDGDTPEKRKYCEKTNLRYLVLKRLPRDGLPRRESTNLRGF